MFPKSFTPLNPSRAPLRTTVTWGLSWIALLLMMPIGAHAEANFLAPFRAYPTGPYPGVAVVADFDGDHYRDVAVTVGPELLIFNGSGDGNLGIPTEVSLGGAVAVGDVNDDGSPDLVLGRGENMTTIFSIRLSNGDGTFASQVDIGSQSGTPQVLKLADVNRDGHVDLLAMTRTPNYSYLVLLLGNGDGSFGPVTFLSLLSEFILVQASDLNSDGTADLVFARSGSGNAVSTRLGNGDGTFGPWLSLNTVVALPISTAVADFNGDGHLDLALGSPANVSIHLGNGDGTFGARQRYFNLKTPASIAVGDVNGDGIVDLVTANGYTSPPQIGTISVFLGAGDGSLVKHSEFATGGSNASSSEPPPSVICSDLNHDGTMDLVAVNPTSNTISLHLGNGDATFGRSAAVSSGPNPYALAAGDFDGDGDVDLATSHSDSTLSIHLANGDGTIAPRIIVTGQHVALDVAVADLDRDGSADLVTLNSDSTVSVHLGSGGASFESPVDYLVHRAPRRLTLADLNGDAIPDLIVNTGYLLASVASMPYISVFLGLGDGRFGPRMDNVMPAHVAWTGVADMNGDHVPDLVVVRDYSWVSILLGTGDGTFGSRSDFPGIEFHGRGSLADVDGDGRTDVVFVGGHFDPNTLDLVCVLRGIGDGTLGSVALYSGPIRGAQAAVADLDLDGHADIAVAGGITNTVSILYGRADGTFDRRDAYGTGGGTYSLAIGDWNGDGRPDIATADFYGGTVSVLQNATGVLAAGPVPAPSSVRLGAAYPNPARVSLAIPFETVTAGPAAIRVYDLSGRIVKVVMEERLPAGRHVVAWDVRTAEGRPAPPGIYFYELALGRERRAKRVAIIR